MSPRKKQENPLISDEAERGFLGRLIAEDKYFHEYSARVKEEDFHSEQHRKIYAAISRMVHSGAYVTKAALIAELARADPDIPAIIAALVAGAAKEKDLGPFADLIARLAGRRRIVEIAEKIKDDVIGADSEIPIEQIRQSAINKLDQVDDGAEAEGKSFGSIIHAVVEDCDQIIKHGKPIGIKSGLKSYDDLVGYMLPGQEIIIGGETGAGKTALAAQLGFLVAKQGLPVWISSLEMEGKELVTRHLGAQGDISAERIQEGRLTAEELTGIFNGVGSDLYSLPIWIDDSPRQSVPMMQARIARAKIKHGIRLVIIDHLQFIRPEHFSKQRDERISEAAEAVKSMAKRLQLPVILISHVSRKVDLRSMHSAAEISRPVLPDLYGSSGIEKAADCVVFVHRPIWFLHQMIPTPGKEDKFLMDKVRWDGKAELIAPKRRGGKAFGVALCNFDEKRTWFSDIEERNAWNFQEKEDSGHDYGAPAIDC